MIFFMKKILLYIIALAAVVACGLVEENSYFFPTDNEPEGSLRMITEVISGEYGASTKATIADSDASFKWSVGDSLAVHVSNGNSHKYVVTTSGASANAATADFVVSYEEGYSRDAFAIFPSTIVAASAADYGQSGASLDVTLPGSYTLAQVSGETTPCPMIAANVPETNWTFYQLCGLLRLTVSAIPPGTKRLEIDFDGKKVWGDFSIASPVTPGTSDIKTAADADHDVIKIYKEGSDVDVTMNNNAWLDGLVLNIPLPTGDYTSITVTAYNALSGGDAILVPITRTFDYTADRLHGTKRTVLFPVFSVSETKRVLFSPGNLQASTSDNGAHWTWGFAAHEWDYVGDNTYHNSRISGNGTVKFTGAGTVDLFCWVGASNTTWSDDLGTTLNAAMYGITNAQTMNSTDTYGNVANESLKSDWGNTITDSYSWRTLTADEWSYLLGIRTRGGSVNGTSNARYTLARINTDATAVNGLILFPDGVTIEASEVSQWGNINKEIGNTWTLDWVNGTLCTSAQWAALSAKGCVFLPMAGAYRYYEKSPSGQEKTPVFQPGTSAGYWSSSPVNETQAYWVTISKSFVDPRSNDKKISNSDRKFGRSVRLVRDIN